MIKWLSLSLFIFPQILCADMVQDLSIGEVEIEFSIIDENLVDSEEWLEPVFSKEQGKRGLASVFPKDMEWSESFELEGQLQVLSEIPYSRPSQYRWSINKKVLNSLRAKKKRK